MDLSVIQNLDTQYNDTYFDHEIVSHLKQPSVAQPKQGGAMTQSRAAGLKQEAKIHKYKHKGLNPLYFLQADSQSIFMLDFKKQCFVKENIDSNQIIP
jgi:hypothetical protein